MKLSNSLLDELAGQIKNIKNPVAYFFTILKRYKNGTFTPSNSLRVETDRKTRMIHQSALENASKRHMKRLRDYGVKFGGDSK